MNPEAFGNTEKLKGTMEFKTKEGDTVTLRWNICRPKTRNAAEKEYIDHEGKPFTLKEKAIGSGKSDEAVIFLPGIALEADTGSVVESAQNFANASQSTTYSISTRLDNPKTKDSQSAQAEAIHQFIALRKLQEVIVVGNSQGATKAIDLTAQLEKAGKKVRALVITVPAGMYNQKPSELAKNFFATDLLDTSIDLLNIDLSKPEDLLSAKSNINTSLRLGKSVAGNIAKEVGGHPLQFRKRVVRELKEASTLNESAKKVRARIVVVLGAKDKVFDSKKIIPETSHDQSMKAQNERIEAMKKIFPNSIDIKVLEPTELANHGLHYMRSGQIANTTLGMLRRMERN